MQFQNAVADASVAHFLVGGLTMAIGVSHARDLFASFARLADGNFMNASLLMGFPATLYMSGRRSLRTINGGSLVASVDQEATAFACDQARDS